MRDSIATPSRGILRTCITTRSENSRANRFLRNSDRELFKLPKIQLKSDVTGEDVTAIVEDSNNDQSSTEPPPAKMSIEISDDGAAAQAKRASAQPSATASPQLEQQRPSPHAMTLPEPAKTVPAHNPRPDVHRLAPMAPASSQPAHPKAVPRAQPNIYPRTNGYPTSVSSHAVACQPPSRGPPSWPDSRLEAIDRIQAQVNLNRASLEQHMREIRHLNQGFVALDTEVRKLVELVHGLAAEIRHQPPQAVPAQRDRMDDDHFELLTNQVAAAMSKTAEIDNLKLKVALLENKLRRQASHDATPNTPFANPFQAAQNAPLPHLQQLVSSVPHLNAPRPPQAPAQAQAQQQQAPRIISYSHHPYTPDSAKPRELPHHDREPSHHQHPAESVEAPAAGGWTSVNTASKRGYPNGVDGHSEHSTPIGSPKRPKLAPMEPRQSQAYQPEARYDPRYNNVVEGEERLQRVHSEQPSEALYPDSTNPSTFIPYSNPNTQDMNPDDSWRPYNQHMVSGASDSPSTGKSPRGRGRGRGGRPRKNPATELHQLTTPEWEKPNWSASQHNSEDGFYHPEMTPSSSRGGLIRRGSGGHGNRVAIPPAMQTSVLPSDPYSHTKKTRTKPIRNADGILIRKDGRPDMRSQSSAANLRKVHARKEEEKRMEAEKGTPHPPSKLSGSWIATNVHSAPDSGASSPAIANTSESPTSQVVDVDMNQSTEERTKDIMKRMFPQGVEEQKSRLMQVHDYFPHNEDKSPQTERSQTQQSEDTAVRTEDVDVRMEDRTPEEERSQPPAPQPAPPVAVGGG
jgi:hypothetical protein